MPHRPVTNWTGDPARDRNGGGPRVPTPRTGPVFDPGGVRDTQSQFETPGHWHEGTATARRPHAISLDYLTAHTLGPAALSDADEGLVVRVWRARHEATPGGGRVLIARANANATADATDYEPEVELFTYAGAPILELDIAFDQSGAPIVVAERGTGAAGASELWIYWYDPFIPGTAFQMFGPGRTPRCLLDDPADLSQSDVVIVYIRNDAGPTGAVCYRQQRDRYGIEYLTPVVGNGTIPYPTLQSEWVGPIVGTGIYGSTEVKLVIGRPAADVIEQHGTDWGYDGPPEVWAVADGGDTVITNDYTFKGIIGAPTGMALEFSEPVESVMMQVWNQGTGRPAALGQVLFALDASPLTKGPGTVLGTHSPSMRPRPNPTQLEFSWPTGFLGVATRSLWRFIEPIPDVDLPYFTEIYIRPLSRIGQVNPPLQLPGIEQMYVEDVVLGEGRRLIVTFSVRIGTSYALLQLATALYPVTADGDEALATLTAESADIKVLVYVVAPSLAEDALAQFFNSVLEVTPSLGLPSGLIELTGPIDVEYPGAGVFATPSAYNEAEADQGTVVPVSGALGEALVVHDQYLGEVVSHRSSMQPVSSSITTVVIHHDMFDAQQHRPSLSLVSGSLA